MRDLSGFPWPLNKTYWLLRHGVVFLVNTFHDNAAVFHINVSFACAEHLSYSFASLSGRYSASYIALALILISYFLKAPFLKPDLIRSRDNKCLLFLLYGHTDNVCLHIIWFPTHRTNKDKLGHLEELGLTIFRGAGPHNTSNSKTKAGQQPVRIKTQHCGINL